MIHVIEHDGAARIAGARIFVSVDETCAKLRIRIGEHKVGDETTTAKIEQSQVDLAKDVGASGRARIRRHDAQIGGALLRIAEADRVDGAAYRWEPKI